MPMGNTYAHLTQAQVNRMVKQFGETVVRQRDELYALINSGQHPVFNAYEGY